MPPFYKISAPNEYLAITGVGISTVRICKSAVIWPLQRYIRFSVQPHDYAIDLQAMTKEKLQFLLPVVFTVGPDVDARGANSSGSRNVQSQVNGEAQEDYVRDDSLMKYAMLLTSGSSRTSDQKTNSFLQNIIKGIIEGETRVLVSSMTMEEIFTEREEFKRRIFRNIQSELDQFGLKIYNANVKELRDAPESNYFESLARKAHEGATNQARVDVAEAQLLGNVGEAKRKGEQEREIAKINAETAVQKTERDSDRAAAEAKLATRKTVLSQNVDIAKIVAARATESRDEELKREVGVKRAAAEMERLRAHDVVKATIAREAKQQAADAKAYETQAAAKASADARVYETEAEAKAANQSADAQAYETRTGAEAKAYQMQVDAKAGADARAYKLETEAHAELEAAKQTADAEACKTKTGADAANYAANKSADAGAYKTLAEAKAGLEAAKQTADANAYRTRCDADAGNYASIKEAEAQSQSLLKEAEGMAAMATAYGRMADALGGPPGLLQYLMIKDGTYIELANANANAIRGLQPKISVWTTGARGREGGSSSSTETMRDIYQMLPPLMTTINEQTGITLPEWQFGRIHEQMADVEKNKQIAKLDSEE